MGRSGGHQRGLSVAAYGENPMAAVTTFSRLLPLGILNPEGELVAGQRCDVFPGI